MKNKSAVAITAVLAFSFARHSVVASVIKLRDDCFCGSGLLSARL